MDRCLLFRENEELTYNERVALMSPAANGVTPGDRSRIVTRQPTPEVDSAAMPLPMLQPLDHSSLNMVLNMPNVTEMGHPDVSLQGLPQQPAFMYFSVSAAAESPEQCR